MTKFRTFITEASRATSKPQVEGRFAKELIAKFPNYQVTAGSGFRLANKVDKPTPEEFSKILDSMGATDIEMFGPKEGANPSSKFIMFTFDMPDYPRELQILLANGGNKGHEYENKLLQLLGTKEASEALFIYNKLGIKPEDVTNIKATGSANSKRQLSFAGPKDIGSTVADIVIETAKKQYYLSLKDKTGYGLYNGGNLTFITKHPNEDEAEFNPDKVKTTKDEFHYKILETLDVDPEAIAAGITAYMNKGDGEKKRLAPGVGWQKLNIKSEANIKNLLASAWGYGYWYVKEESKKQIKMFNIDSAKDALNLIGKITGAYVKYPGSSKDTQIRIECDSPIMGKCNYFVAIRNAAGKILPVGIRIMVYVYKRGQKLQPE